MVFQVLMLVAGHFILSNANSVIIVSKHIIFTQLTTRPSTHLKHFICTLFPMMMMSVIHYLSFHQPSTAATVS